jgi:hypothetical protein
MKFFSKIKKKNVSEFVIIIFKSIDYKTKVKKMASLHDLEKICDLLLNKESVENLPIYADAWREHKRRKWEEYLEKNYGKEYIEFLDKKLSTTTKTCCEAKTKIPLPLKETNTAFDKDISLPFDSGLLFSVEKEKDKESSKDLDLSNSEIQKLAVQEDRLNRLKKFNVGASIQKIEESLAVIHEALKNVKNAMEKEIVFLNSS